MCDPISALAAAGSSIAAAAPSAGTIGSMILPLAAGAGLSVLGGREQATAVKHNEEAQLQQQVAQSAAENQALQANVDKQKQHQNIALQTVGDANQTITPEAATSTQAAATQQRKQAAAAAMAGSAATPTGIPVPHGTSPAVQAEYAKRDAVDLKKATNVANAGAKLGGFGDVFTNLGLTTADAARQIDTQNNFSQGDASLLPSQQQNAAFQATGVIPSISTDGQTMQSLGNLLGTVAGSGKLGGITNGIASGVGKAVQGFNPFGGTP